MAGGTLIKGLMNRQKLLIMPRLHDYGGDVSKQWFIFYSYRNPATGKMQRFRLYEGFTERSSAEEKRKYGLMVMERLRLKLQNGWSPFEDDPQVIYSDNLQYQQVARKFGRMRTGNKRFAFYSSQWLEQRAGIRPSTYTTYKSKLRYFNEFLKKNKLEENDISEFSRDEARAFNIYLKRERKLSHKTINEYNVLMRAFFGYLAGEGLIKVNPFTGIKPLKTETKHPRIYPKHLLEKISEVAAVTDPQLLFAIRIIFNCLIRPNELRQLRLGDIDFHAGKIRVAATIAKDKEERHVDVPDYIVKDMLINGFHLLPSAYFLITTKGLPGAAGVSRNFLHKRFQRLKKAAGIPKEYILYAFKHTGMVELKHSGADWLDIRNQAGHESLDQTIEYTMELMKEGSRHIREKAPKL